MKIKAKLKNRFTGEIVEVTATTDTPGSSYGQPVWVDEDGNEYGQIQFSPPLGFELIEDE